MVGIMYLLFALDEQRHIVVYLDGLPPVGDLRQAKVNALRELQSASGDELRLLAPLGMLCQGQCWEPGKASRKIRLSSIG